MVDGTLSAAKAIMSRRYIKGRAALRKRTIAIEVPCRKTILAAKAGNAQLRTKRLLEERTKAVKILTRHREILNSKKKKIKSTHGIIQIEVMKWLRANKVSILEIALKIKRPVENVERWMYGTFADIEITKKVKELMEEMDAIFQSEKEFNAEITNSGEVTTRRRPQVASSNQEVASRRQEVANKRQEEDAICRNKATKYVIMEWEPTGSSQLLLNTLRVSVDTLKRDSSALWEKERKEKEEMHIYPIILSTPSDFAYEVMALSRSLTEHKADSGTFTFYCSMYFFTVFDRFFGKDNMCRKTHP